MPFDWRFRNFKRDPQPFLNGAVIDTENARNNLVQNAGNSMEGYTPLESTLATQAMEGYRPVVPATQSQLAAGASQAMQGYTPNGAGRPSVPNDMHGGMGQQDLEGYGESLQAASDAVAQAQAKEQQIADIESQIATLEKRIADNKAKLSNWTGNADKIAAIEARKINVNDPTSIWRWKIDKDEARRIANEEKDKNKQLAKNNALYEIQNELASIVVNDKMDSSTRNAHLSKLADLKTLAQKNGLDPIDIDKKIKEVKGDGGEQTSREAATTDFETLLNNPNLSVEMIDNFEASNPNLSRADWGKLDNKRAELINNDNKIKLNKRYEAARKKAGIDPSMWKLMSKAKRKEVLDKSGL